VHGTAPHAVLGWIVAALAVAALANQREPPIVDPRVPPIVKPRMAALELRALRDGERLDLNRASIDELALIPGIGPKLAERIIVERKARGGYARVEEVCDVRGVGPKTWERIKPFLELRGDPQKRSMTYDADTPSSR
jgi:competence protein ComEA